MGRVRIGAMWYCSSIDGRILLLDINGAVL